MSAAQVLIGEVAELNPSAGKVLRSDAEVAYMPMSAVSAESSTAIPFESRVASDVSGGLSYFQNNDILVAKITPCFENGKIAQARITQEHGFGSTEFHVLRAREKRLHSRYLLHFLRQDWVSKEGERRMTGSAGQRRVPKHFLEHLAIPLPPLAEQRRIAAILDKAEALRAKRRQAVVQREALTQALFFDTFGDPVTNPKNLKVDSLGEYLTFVTSGGRGWAKYYAPNGSRFIRSLDVRMNFISDSDKAFIVAPENAEARRTKVQSGDVLLTITGSRIGRVAPVPDDLGIGYISQHVAILRVNKQCIDPRFLSFYLSLEAGGQRQIASAQYGQTKPGLNFEQIRRFKIPVPSVRLQEEFARRVAKAEQLSVSHEKSSAELDALFASLQHSAFRGEL